MALQVTQTPPPATLPLLYQCFGIRCRRTITIGLSSWSHVIVAGPFRQPAAILDISALFCACVPGGEGNGDLFKPVAWPSSLNLISISDSRTSVSDSVATNKKLQASFSTHYSSKMSDCKGRHLLEASCKTNWFGNSSCDSCSPAVVTALNCGCDDCGVSFTSVLQCLAWFRMPCGGGPWKFLQANMTVLQH